VLAILALILMVPSLRAAHVNAVATLVAPARRT